MLCIIVMQGKRALFQRNIDTTDYTSISVDCFDERRSFMENLNLTLIMLFLILYIIKSSTHPLG